MKFADHRTILAVEPTQHGLAFAAFSLGELFDWGRTERGRKYDEVALVDRLVGHFAVDILILENPDASGCRRGARVRVVLGALRVHAQARKLKLKLIERTAMRNAWRATGAKTSQMIAARIAKKFPELLALVPRPRKPFMPEDERVRIFGAISLALEALGARPSSFEL